MVTSTVSPLFFWVMVMAAILDVLAAHLHHVRDALAGVQQKLEGKSLFRAYGVVFTVRRDFVIGPGPVTLDLILKFSTAKHGLSLRQPCMIAIRIMA